MDVVMEIVFNQISAEVQSRHSSQLDVVNVFVSSKHLYHVCIWILVGRKAARQNR